MMVLSLSSASVPALAVFSLIDIAPGAPGAASARDPEWDGWKTGAAGESDDGGTSADGSGLLSASIEEKKASMSASAESTLGVSLGGAAPATSFGVGNQAWTNALSSQ